MLPKTWRVVARNNTGAVITTDSLQVKAHPWNFDANGAVQYGSEIALITDAEPADQATIASATQNNSTGKYFGIKGSIEAAGAGTSGAVELYIEWADEAGAFPSDKTGVNVTQDLIQLAALSVAAAPGRATNFSYE